MFSQLWQKIGMANPWQDKKILSGKRNKPSSPLSSQSRDRGGDGGAPGIQNVSTFANNVSIPKVDTLNKASFQTSQTPAEMYANKRRKLTKHSDATSTHDQRQQRGENENIGNSYINMRFVNVGNERKQQHHSSDNVLGFSPGYDMFSVQANKQYHFQNHQHQHNIFRQHQPNIALSSIPQELDYYTNLQQQQHDGFYQQEFQQPIHNSPTQFDSPQIFPRLLQRRQYSPAASQSHNFRPANDMPSQPARQSSTTVKHSSYQQHMLYEKNKLLARRRKMNLSEYRKLVNNSKPLYQSVYDKEINRKHQSLLKPPAGSLSSSTHDSFAWLHDQKDMNKVRSNKADWFGSLNEADESLSASLLQSRTDELRRQSKAFSPSIVPKMSRSSVLSSLSSTLPQYAEEQSKASPGEDTLLKPKAEIEEQEQEEQEKEKEEEATDYDETDDEVDESVHIGPNGETFDEEDYQRIEAAWDSDGDPDEELADGFNAQLSRQHLMCLRPSVWLNDEVINFNLQIELEQLRRASAENGETVKYFIWNTQFYSKLFERGVYTYKNVRRWTKRKKVDVSKLDKVLVPINVNDTHWTLAIVNIRDKQFEYLDSLNNDNEECLLNLKKWLADEWADKGYEPPLDVSDWPLIHRKDVPQQNNSCDCGVFLTQFARTYGLDRDVPFTQRNMPYFRRDMLLRILNYRPA